ncbi:MGMT family protein [Neptuniibacter sp. CAU 1671]|uniref:MGMT family protein n=1 Tax=Neptuniibacter sp. CAU 1671 TaxID=3032593 RepID=UPI0023D9C5C6|nr:MGMT family protein [Neptuniibacter sp. CAU 1671]MDF2183113.1 MGMT family protein [Neptuniibacter sp. CAU 1671]
MQIEAMQQAIWQIVSLIPAGRVATYGQIAALAGFPKQARAVGRCLSRLPEDSQLPWHRVINAQGRISFADLTPAFIEQSQRLRAEGVQVEQGRIRLREYQWQP